MVAGKKSLPKPRNERQRKARSLRRGLLEISPETNMQQQSPLFSLLPREIRYIIFEYTFAQRQDHTRLARRHMFTKIHRPGHEYRTYIDTALLLTCRLAYYEGHAIPMRGATHHVCSPAVRPQETGYLFTLTSQQLLDVYHLHQELTSIVPYKLTAFLGPSLNWQKVTWTLIAPDLPYWAESLRSIVLPSSCQEVTLELELGKEVMRSFLPQMREGARACSQVAMAKADGSILEFDPSISGEYTWGDSGGRIGEGLPPLGTDRALCHLIRVCWRGKVSPKHASHDSLNCLEGDRITELRPLS